MDLSGYWMDFHKAAFNLHQESNDQDVDEEAILCDVWAGVF